MIRDDEIESLALDMARFLHLKGVSCMQLKRDEHGCLKFIEVNARLAGSSVITRLAGLDLVRALISLAIGREWTPRPIHEITVVRFFDSLIFDPLIIGGTNHKSSRVHRVSI